MPSPMFTIKSLVSTELPKYEHGYSLEQVERLKLAKAAIEKRNLAENPVTLEEFKTIIVPWNRVHRTEVFNLIPAKKVAAKKPRVAKVKKLTKKALQEKLNDVIFRKASGNDITNEEEEFLAEQLKLAGDLL